MRNRAKCKLCNSIIESFHASDYVYCNCGHIYVEGGPALKCGAGDWVNFIRVDDEGNEIIPQVIDADLGDVKPLDIQPGQKPKRREVIEMIDELANTINGLPENAKWSAATQLDIYSVLLLLSAAFKADAD